jgi:hypothetical protein
MTTSASEVIMIARHMTAWAAVVSVGVVWAAGRATLATPSQDERPALSLRGSPVVAFAPAEVLFVGELKGGPNDYEEYYCAAVEWDWDDDTRSTRTEDCEPYQAGKSEIQRRFTMRHTFDLSGTYEVRLNLKNKDKVLATARTRVEVRGGVPQF